MCICENQCPIKDSMENRDIQEIEFKWAVPSPDGYDVFLDYAKKLGGHFSRPKRVRINDSYLDTKDRLFGLTRTSCRLRNIDSRWELTMKALSTFKGGLAKRREKTYPLPLMNSYSDALKYCENRLLRRMLGGRKFKMLFEIKNNRIMRKLTLSDGTETEASFDDVDIMGNKKVIKMKEIELEFSKGDMKNFESFTRNMTNSSSLVPAKISKVETALREFSLRMQHPANRDYRFSRKDTLSYAAVQTMKKYVEVLKNNEPLVRVGIDEEGVHDMRVATRRLRTALRIFEAVMPDDAKRIFKDLAWLGRSLGRVRDLQLQMIGISGYEDLLSHEHSRYLNIYRGSMYEQIEEKQKRLLSVLNSKRYTSLLHSLDLLGEYEDSVSSKRVMKAAKRPIKKAMGKVLSQSADINKQSPDENLHQLRLSIKKLRYICEFFQPVFKPKMVKTIKKTKELQDYLGDNQDALVSVQVLSTAMNDTGLEGEDAGHMKNALNKMIEIKRKESEKARNAFFKAWKVYKRKTMNNLLNEIL